jgi:hypothetical protein
MKRWIINLIIVFCGLVVLGGLTVGVTKILDYEKAEQEKMEQEKIQMTYLELYNAFYLASGKYYFSDMEVFGKYREIGYNDYSVNCNVYLVLKMYGSRAGIILAYETAIEYLSQEFEPDGSLRLYNNGLHPEIEAYVA